METRVLIACALIGLLVVIALIVAAITLPKRRRDRDRRRGIKTHQHRMIRKASDAS